MHTRRSCVRARARVHGSGTWTGKNLILDETLDQLTHQDHRPGSTYSSGSSPWINLLIRIIVLDQLTHQDHRPGSTYSSGSSPWINLLIMSIALDQLTHQDHRPGSTYSSGSSPWINLLIRIIVLDQLTHQDHRPGSTYSSGSSSWVNLLIILGLHTSVTTLTISCSMAYFHLQNIIPRHNFIIQDKQQITQMWMSFTTV